MSMKVQQAKRAAEAGFTLIELMIVIAIIGILAAIAIPQYEQYIVTSKATTISQDFHQAVTEAAAAVAAAQAGQTTVAPLFSNMPNGASITWGTGGATNNTDYTPTDLTGTTTSVLSVVLKFGSGSVAAATASALSAAGITNCGTATTSCTAAIDGNGTLTYTGS